MRTTRRKFLRAGAGSLGMAVPIGAPLAGAAQKSPRSKKGQKIRCLDYGLSFICNPLPANALRFWVESRTTVIDERAGVSTEYYQCGSCKGEDTFVGPGDLFKKDSYDFIPIFGGEDLLLFRRGASIHFRAGYREVRRAEKTWGVPILKLREPAVVTVLDTWEKIRDATAAAVPIVTQTEISNPETGLRAIIECPTKTMNMGLDRRLYQVDTGPVAFPDLSKRYARQIDCLSLAFLAFNAPHFADFVIEQPTPVIEKGREVCKIYHYSGPFSLKAKNVVLALGRV